MPKKREFIPGLTKTQEEGLRLLRKMRSKEEKKTRAETVARIQGELEERREKLRRGGATKKQIAEADLNA